MIINKKCVFENVVLDLIEIFQKLFFKNISIRSGTTFLNTHLLITVYLMENNWKCISDKFQEKSQKLMITA